MSAAQPEIYTILYLIQGKERPLPIKLASNELVGTLMKEIKAEQPILSHLAADELRLYRANIPGDPNLVANVEKWMQQHNEPLDAWDELSTVFDGPPKEKTIHIIVQLPEIPFTGQKRPRPSDFDDPRALPEPVTPSLADYATVYARLGSNFRQDRPLSPEAIPLALFDPIFGQFADDVRTCQPTKADNSFAHNLRVAMAKAYDNEAARVNMFRELWNSENEEAVEPNKVGSTQYQTDGHYQVANFYVVITEGKNEITRVNADPVLQASMYYISSVHHLRKIGITDSFPCLIVYYVGPYIGFAGIVWSETPQVEVFTPLYPFHTNPHESEVAGQVTRAIAAARKAISSLRQRYLNLLDVPRKLRSKDQYLFPHQSSFSVGDEIVNFTYVNRVQSAKLVFRATTVERRKPIIVKFTRRYSEAAHRFSAENGIAPALHAVQKLPGGWLMVVMEYLDQELYETPKSENDEQYGRASRALNILHQGGFVHGDIRGANILVKKQWSTSDMLPGVMLFDFDWAGESGTVVYPPNLNPAIQRPMGAIDGHPILQNHDTEMLNGLFGKMQ